MIFFCGFDDVEMFELCFLEGILITLDHTTLVVSEFLSFFISFFGFYFSFIYIYIFVLLYHHLWTRQQDVLLSPTQLTNIRLAFSHLMVYIRHGQPAALCPVSCSSYVHVEF